MALKDRIVNIAYTLKDKVTGQVGKITSGFKSIEKASDSSSKKVEGNNLRLGNSFRGIVSSLNKAKIGILALGAVIVGGVSAISKWTAAANIQIRAETKLATTLTNLSGASKEQIQSLKDQASALQVLTGFGDEQTISAQAMLGTFQLNSEQILKLTPRLLDMAESARKAGSDQVDLETISIALGKAMTTGIGSLSLYGVAMSDAQKEAFKLADQNGKVAVLTEVLDGNFKGLAEAVGSTYEGAVRKGEAASGDFLEVLGTLFTENKAFIKLQEFITDSWVKMGEGISGSSGEIGVAITLVANAVLGAASIIRVAFNTIQIAIKTMVAFALPPLELLTRALSALTPGDTSKVFELMSNDIRQYSRDLTEGIKGDFADMGNALDNFTFGQEEVSNVIEKTANKNKQLTPTIEANTKAINDQVKAEKKLAEEKNKQLTNDGQALFNQTRTALEKLNIRQSEYKTLLDAGKISQDTFNRAMLESKQAIDVLQSTENKSGAVDKESLSLSEQVALNQLEWEREKLVIKQKQAELDKKNPFKVDNRDKFQQLADDGVIGQDTLTDLNQNVEAKLKLPSKEEIQAQLNAEFEGVNAQVGILMRPDVQAALASINETIAQAQSNVTPLVVPIVFKEQGGTKLQKELQTEVLKRGRVR